MTIAAFKGAGSDSVFQATQSLVIESFATIYVCQSFVQAIADVVQSSGTFSCTHGWPTIPHVVADHFAYPGIYGTFLETLLVAATLEVLDSHVTAATRVHIVAFLVLLTQV